MWVSAVKKKDCVSSGLFFCKFCNEIRTATYDVSVYTFMASRLYKDFTNVKNFKM